MTNFEKYKDFFEECKANNIKYFGVDKDGKPKRCNEVSCAICAFGGSEKTCEEFRWEWKLKDDGEPIMTAEEAWKLARKIFYNKINGGFDFDELTEIFDSGNIYEVMSTNTAYEAKEKIEAWEKREKLKPCPLCGSAAALEIDEDRTDGYENYAIRCNYNKGGCGTTGGYRETKEKAIELWNKRSGE